MGIRLVDNTVQVKAALREQIANGLNAAATFFVTEAKNAAPVDTGFLKAHLGVTVAAVPSSLSAEVRSLARYSAPTDTGIRGTLWWTKSWLATREKFKQFLMTKGTSAGAGVIRAAEEEFHGPMGRKGRGF